MNLVGIYFINNSRVDHYVNGRLDLQGICFFDAKGKSSTNIPTKWWLASWWWIPWPLEVQPKTIKIHRELHQKRLFVVCREFESSKNWGGLLIILLCQTWTSRVGDRIRKKKKKIQQKIWPNYKIFHQPRLRFPCNFRVISRNLSYILGGILGPVFLVAKNFTRKTHSFSISTEIASGPLGVQRTSIWGEKNGRNGRVSTPLGGSSHDLDTWLITSIYKPFGPFIRGITPFRGLTNHG